ncbi:MAG TPA: HAD hydrolase family protein [Cytophagaceae bacterium]|jgi:3-deoxy-D-manno-octulosonate 8-phosphate phosphatase (KDO 8-P phosphatase)|nr:HAD hydrolase family protein [Cytophagaceae bacterium]
MNTEISDHIKRKASRIRLVLTDVDGVLTDNGVYYSAQGEELKRFSFRDGMGVERLRTLAGIETGIITRENSLPVAKRAEKLKISELHMGSMNKEELLDEIAKRRNISFEEIAFIGDDINDRIIMEKVGLCACPADAMIFVKEIADFKCLTNGGYGAFREFAEFIIMNKNMFN